MGIYVIFRYSGYSKNLRTYLKIKKGFDLNQNPFYISESRKDARKYI